MHLITHIPKIIANILSQTGEYLQAFQIGEIFWDHKVLWCPGLTSALTFYVDSRHLIPNVFVLELGIFQESSPKLKPPRTVPINETYLLFPYIFL